ncbi:H-NS histone family protein [Variovorax sp. J22G73]|uniref:H-NS histone family protein n=1 Tax=unclassified Variovorax TaxID=663243 RepID=UPI0025773FCE|nr:MULTISPECIES: H-NS histone family protein [unclassified Variovorax]MDM0007457.1 H-NS histone family protein [Variovorax sp. J22R203]MDM0100184.1 H-NS histone family protein [Variovorax sp. J22G73]
MAETYEQLQHRIADLEQEVHQLRQRAVAQVLREMRENIARYAITPQMLFGRGASTARKGNLRPKGASTTQTLVYSDGKGNKWTGRGRRPLWLRDAMASGKTLDEFRV